MTASRRRLLLACGAGLISVLCSLALVEGYVVGVQRFLLPIPPYVLRIKFIRGHLIGAMLRRLEQFIEADADERSKDAFETIWDNTSGVLLSRKLFQSVDMYGARKYMYKPGLRKIGVWARIGGRRAIAWETEDTPQTRDALKGLDTDGMWVDDTDTFLATQVHARAAHGFSSAFQPITY